MTSRPRPKGVHHETKAYSIAVFRLSPGRGLFRHDMHTPSTTHARIASRRFHAPLEPRVPGWFALGIDPITRPQRQPRSIRGHAEPRSRFAIARKRWIRLRKAEETRRAPSGLPRVGGRWVQGVGHPNRPSPWNCRRRTGMATRFLGTHRARSESLGAYQTVHRRKPVAVELRCGESRSTRVRSIRCLDRRSMIEGGTGRRHRCRHYHHR